MKIKNAYPIHDVLLYFMIITGFFIGKDILGLFFVLAGAVISLFGFLFTGVTAGLGTNRLRKNIDIFIDFFSLGVLVWMGFAFFECSFIFEKMVLIFSKGIFIIIVTLTFNHRYGRNPIYIRILSLVLFIYYPIFLEAYTSSYKFLCILYIFLWVLLLRFRFQNLYGTKKWRQVVAVFLVYFIFLVSSLLAVYLLKDKIVFPKIKHPSLFIRTEKFPVEDALGVIKGTLIDKNITHIPKYAKEKKEVVLILSSFLKEFSQPLEVENGHLRLRDIFRNLRYGIEETEKEKTISLLEEYKDLKIRERNITLRGELSQEINKASKNLKIKTSALMEINKLYYNNNLEKVMSKVASLKQLADSYFSDNQVKEEFKNAINEFKKWKIYSIFNNVRNTLKGDIKKTEEEKELSELFDDIEKEMSLSSLGEQFRKIEDLKRDLEKVSPEKKKGFQNAFRKMLGLKIELALTENLENLVRELKDKFSPEHWRNEVCNKMESIVQAQSSNNFLKGIKELKEMYKSNKITPDVFKDRRWQEIIDSKAKLFASKERMDINEQLDKGILSENKKRELLEAMERISSSEESTLEDLEKLKAEIENLTQAGLMYEDTKEELFKLLDEFSQIEEAKNILREFVQEEKEKPVSHHENWKQILENKVSNNKDIKADIRLLLKKLKGASSIQEIYIISEKILEVLKALEMDKKISSETLEKLKQDILNDIEIKQKTVLKENLALLIEKLNMIKAISKKNEKRISKILAELHTHYAKREPISNALTEEIEKISFEPALKGLKEPLADTESTRWEIFIFPQKILISKKTIANIKVIAVYEQALLNDVTSEVTWQFQHSNRAWIDTQGIIHALSTGQTKAFAKYRGIESESIEITVVEPLLEDEQIISNHIK